MGSRVLNNSFGSNPVVGLRGGFNNRQDFIFVKTNDPRQNFERVKADGAGQNDQFDNVDPALTAFKTGNKGLVASEPIRQVFLAEARFDARVDQRLAECHLPFASDCLCHASHTFCDVASG